MTLRRRLPPPRATPRAEEDGGPLFSDDVALFDNEVECVSPDGPLDVRDMPLGDFHVVRTVLAKVGLLEDHEVVIDCHNCSASLTVHPSARVETVMPPA